MSSALGFPDFQRITQWFGRPLDQADALALGAGAHVVGPLDVRTFASVVVCVKPTGGTVTVTVDQLVPGGPAALVVSSSFVVNDGNVVFEAFVLLAGEVRVTFQGSAGGETLAYAIVPANTNTNAEVAALTQLGFQHNDVVVATETAIDLEDAAQIGWTFLDDPANLRMKVTPTLRQNGAAAGSLYRWDGAAWTPTGGVIVDDAARKITFAGDTTLYRSAAGDIKTDGRYLSALNIVARVGAASQVNIGDSGSGLAALLFGSTGDTNLYRLAAGVLATDSQLKFTVAAAPVQYGNAAHFAGAATAGAAALPANPAKFLLILDNAGATFKVPCYNP